MKISTGLPDWTAAPAFCVHDAFAVNVTAPLLTTEASFVNTSSPLDIQNVGVGFSPDCASVVNVPSLVTGVLLSASSVADLTSTVPEASLTSATRR